MCASTKGISFTIAKYTPFNMATYITYCELLPMEYHFSLNGEHGHVNNNFQQHEEDKKVEDQGK